MEKRAIDEVINGLNLDLAWEYAAGIQYTQHASMLKGAAYFALVDELEEHAREEFNHARILSEIIQFLGGIPTIEAATRLQSMNSKEMLQQDLKAEYDAIRRYNNRIAQLESLGMYDSSQRIRNIIVEEQEHAIDLEVALGIEK